MQIELQVEPDAGVEASLAVALAERVPAWAAATAPHLELHDPRLTVCVRIVEAAESQRLNAAYRGIDKPTNVLSFPAELPAAVLAALAPEEPVPYGDLALCWPVVVNEAASQGKAPLDHCAHLVVHGLLHLGGYDHEESAAAEAMEALERQVLNRFAITDPYLEVAS